MNILLQKILLILAWVISYCTLIFLFGFVLEFHVPTGINSGGLLKKAEYVYFDLILIFQFGLQHSIIAHPKIRSRLESIFSKKLYKSIYLITSSLSLVLLFWLWTPITNLIWNTNNIVISLLLKSISIIGILIIVVSIFQTRDFHFIKSIQKGYKELPFLYKHVRYPSLLGFLMVFWSTPHMTFGNFIFALGMTGYIFIGISNTEKQLVFKHGQNYRLYKKMVPMILPIPILKKISRVLFD